MAYVVGMIGPSESIEHIKKYNVSMDDNIKIKYIPYKKISEAINLCNENASAVDAFLFTGELPYIIISKSMSEINKPCYHLSATREELYKQLLKFSVHKKSFDFSRIYIDFISVDYDCMGLDEIIPAESFPYTFPSELMQDINKNVNEMTDYEQLETVYEYLFSRHVQLHEQGKIDVSITRISSIAKKLQALGYDVCFLVPGKEEVARILKTISTDFKIESVENSLYAIGNISTPLLKDASVLKYENELRQLEMYKAIIDFSLKNNIPYSVQKNSFNIELFITKGLLIELTDNYAHCPLNEYLSSVLPFKVNIGWGVGLTIKAARDNAENACSESLRRSGNNSYVITEESMIIGPLSQKNCIQYIDTTDPKLEQISQKTKLSLLTLQKLKSIISKLGTNEFSSSDISYYMGITERSGNRIINKLEEGGFASQAYKKSEKLKGRPKKIYKIDLEL